MESKRMNFQRDSFNRSAQRAARCYGRCISRKLRRLERFSRPEAEARIKALGGTAKSDVTRKTTYLVVGAEPGSKLARAQELGTKRLTEEEFLKLVQ